MKTIKTSLVLLLFLFTTNGFSQSKELVYIRIQENIVANGVNSFMRITYPAKPSKWVDLTTIGKRGSGSEENGKIIQAELAALINDKYEIISCSVGSDVNTSTTIIILSRTKE